MELEKFAAFLTQDNQDEAASPSVASASRPTAVILVDMNGSRRNLSSGVNDERIFTRGRLPAT
jgi:hypothetical protein